MFGINGGEAIIILVVAVLVIGPERLPKYAEQLAGLVKRARTLMAEAKEKVGEELGPEIADMDWAQLDPRRYDPRRIVRDALLDDTPAAPKKTTNATNPSKPSKVAETAVGAATAAAAAAGAVPPREDGAVDRASETGAVRWPEPQPALQAGEAAPFDPEAT